MSRTIGGMVVAASLVAAAACGPGYQKLEVDKIQSVAVTIDETDRRFCAYAPVALRALVTYKDGKQAQSQMPGDNQRERLRTSEFEWTSTFGTVDDAAVLRLSHDPLAWLDKPIRVSARVAVSRAMARGIELRTARLLLRPFQRDGALAYRNDAELARFLPHIPQPFTRSDAEEFVTVNMTEPWESLPTFAVVLDENVIGTVNFEIYPTTRTAMLGYAIARAHWDKGIAVEAATAALDWCATSTTSSKSGHRPTPTTCARSA